MRSLVSLLLIIEGQVSELVVKRLCDIMKYSDNSLELGHSLEVMRRVIEYKDIDEHPLDLNEGNRTGQPAYCQYLKLSLTDVTGVNEVKYIIIKFLEDQWPDLILRFPTYLEDYSLQEEHIIVSFLSLWEALISVKNNLNVEDTKEFYNGLDILITPLLSHGTPLIVWSNIINLLNEVLCYGSTLALQEVIAEEPCSLATRIIRAVNISNFLEFVPCGQSASITSQSHLAASQNTSSSNNSNRTKTSDLSKVKSKSTKIHPGSSIQNISSSSDGSESLASTPSTSKLTNFTQSITNVSSVQNINIFPKSCSIPDLSKIENSISNSCNKTLNMSCSRTSLSIDDSCNMPSSSSLDTNSTSAPIMDICTSFRDVLSSPSSCKNDSSHNSEKKGKRVVELRKPIDGLELLKSCYDNDMLDDTEDEDSDTQMNESSTDKSRVSNITRLEKSQSEKLEKIGLGNNELNRNTGNYIVINNGNEQHYRSDEEQYLAHELDDMGLAGGNSSEEGFSSTHHRSVVVFHKVVLLVLKCIAVTVKEARGEVSSSSSECSSPRSGGSGTEDMDMEIIGRR